MRTWRAILDSRTKRPALSKIVNYNPPRQGLGCFLRKLHVLRVDLIIVLRLLVQKHNIERDLVRLINDRAMAGGHFANVEIENAGNRA